MRSKFTIVLSLIFGISANAFCCLMATQERIIPIGTSENCLIAIEIIAHRYGEGTYQEKEVWDLNLRLKGFNENYSEFLIEELSLEKGIENSSIEKIIKQEMKKAIQICDRLTDFEIFEPKEISFCDYQKDCSILQLIESEEQLKFRLKNEQEEHPIYYLGKEYEGEIAKPYKKSFDFYFKSSDQIMGTDLKISSIRQYENSTHKLLIFYLGTGQELIEAETNKLPEKKCINLIKN